MCEKPMAHNTADARKMIEAWKKSGKKFTIGYQNRLRDDTQTLHASCENRELGEIYFAKAHALRRRAVPTWGCLLYTSSTYLPNIWEQCSFCSGAIL